VLPEKEVLPDKQTHPDGDTLMSIIKPETLCNPVLRLVAFAFLLAAVSASAQIREAEYLVEATTADMLALIEEAQLYVDEDPERFYVAVEALLNPVIDFPRFARSVMAAHYKRATPEQRERFAEGFKWSLVRTYALALTEFNDGGVNIIPSDRPPKRPDRASVKQEIRSEGEVYPVIYSMALNKEGEWRVMNIIINGINMGLTYRNQFASAVNDPIYGGDMDKAIDGWVASLGAIDTGAGESDAAAGSVTASGAAGSSGGAH
jgi:phospholipid transport system substrate-binding protein